MPNCPRCDRTIAEEDVFCRHCGAALQAAPERQAFMADMAADFEGALKDHPRDPDALYNLALSRMYGGQVAEAAECLNRVIELAPDFADAHGKLAVCLWNLGDRDAARRVIARAVSLAPADRRLQEMRKKMAGE